MVLCCVIGCGNRSARKSKQQCNKENETGGITFHKFPQDEVKKQQWLNGINRAHWQPPKNARVCSVHFTEDSFTTRRQEKNRIIADFASPTITSSNSIPKSKVNHANSDQHMSPVLTSSASGPTSTEIHDGSDQNMTPLQTPLHQLHTPTILRRRKALQPLQEEYPRKLKLPPAESTRIAQHLDSIKPALSNHFFQTLSPAPSPHVSQTSSPARPPDIWLSPSPAEPSDTWQTPCNVLHTPPLPVPVPHDVGQSSSPAVLPDKQQTPSPPLSSNVTQTPLSARPLTVRQTVLRTLLPNVSQTPLCARPPSVRQTLLPTVSSKVSQTLPTRPPSVRQTVLRTLLRNVPHTPLHAGPPSVRQTILRTLLSNAPQTPFRARPPSVRQTLLPTLSPKVPQIPSPAAAPNKRQTPSPAVPPNTSQTPSPLLPPNETPLPAEPPDISSAPSLTPSPTVSYEVLTAASPAESPPSQTADSPEKRQLKKDLSKERKKNAALKHKIRMLQQSNRRRKKSLLSLKTVIEGLKKSRFMAENFNCLLNIGKDYEELIYRQIKAVKGQKTKQKYGPELRAFACTLHYYSPRAYNYVRKKFRKSLPHARTISRWYFGICGKPGFTQEALDALSAKAKTTSETLCAALIMDEMHIRKHVDKNFEGYVDMGEGTESPDRVLASQALTFMVVAINGSWKIPVGYFLISSLNAEEKAALVIKCLSLLDKTGIRMISLTFDGTTTNFSIAKKLGCKIDDPDNLEPWFPHPENANNKVYVFPDPSHMIKLVRNTFADWMRFFNESKDTIKWEYLKELYKIQETEGVHLANKLTSQHIYYANKIMNVRLATQLISRSTSKALEVCKKLDLEEFKSSAATSEFLLNFDRLFDILNSHSIYGKGSKKALCAINKEETFEFFSKMAKYIKSLHLDKEKPEETTLLKSTRFTGFLGFLICMKTAESLFNDLCGEGKPLKYIPFYKLSQDHVEMFFGLIRARGGFNNNPTARHFRAAYTRCLAHMELKDDRSGNCMPIENITLLYCSSASKNPDKIINLTCKNSGAGVMTQEEISEEERFKTFDVKEVEDHFYHLEARELTLFVKNAVTYIAGFVAKSLKKSLKCDICIAALTHDPVEQNRLLLDTKDLGGLTVPGKDVVRVAESCEKIIRTVIHQYDTKFISRKNTTLKLTNDLMALYSLPENNSAVFNHLDEHMFDQEPLSNHKYLLIRSIAVRYFDVRLNHVVRKMVDKANSQRHVSNKLILFKGY